MKNPPNLAEHAAQAEAVTLPPHNIDAEQGLLSCILYEPNCLDDVSEIVQPEHFYLPPHQRMFHAMLRADLRRGTTWQTLLPYLQEADFETVGGVKAYIAELAAACMGTTNRRAYAEQIRDLWQRRTLIEALHGTIEKARLVTPDGSAQEHIDAAEEVLYRINEAAEITPEAVPLIQAATEALKRIDQIQKGELVSLKTGLAALDEKMGGLFPGELYVVAGRPAMGKTVMGLTMAYNAAKAGAKALFFSLEMPREQLANRILARETGINAKRQREQVSTPDMDQLSRATRSLATIPLYIDDTSSLTVSQIRSRVRRHARRQGVELVIIDYLGLVASTRDTMRVYQIEEITKGLKSMAKDFKIPVVLLAQINRGVETRDDKRPMLSDLRDSGSVEQDADAVILLYRHEYYLDQGGEPTKQKTETGEAFQKRLAEWHVAKGDSKGVAEAIVAKLRQGEAGTVRLAFDAKRQTFGDLEAETGALAFGTGGKS